MTIGARIVLRPAGSTLPPVDVTSVTERTAEAGLRMRRIHQAPEDPVGFFLPIGGERKAGVAFQTRGYAELALGCIKRGDRGDRPARHQPNPSPGPQSHCEQTLSPHPPCRK